MHAIQTITILALALVAGLTESTSARSHAIFPKAHAQRAAPNRIDASKFSAAKRAMRLGLAANPDVRTQPETRVRKIRKHLGAVSEEKRDFDPFAPSEHILEMRKIELKREASVHPVMYYQQHANRAIARLAHLSGRQDALEAREGQLEDNLRKRWESLNFPPANLKIRKRSTVKTQLMKKRQRVEDRQDNRDRQMPAVGNNAASSNISVTSNSTSGSNNGGGPGFSEAELAALVQNTQTDGPEDQANVLGLDIQANDNSYYATLKIGTPGKDFKVLIDSGSADFWVPSTNCPTCGSHQTLGSSTSSSFRASKNNFRVVYGSGEVDGTIVQDTIVLGNLTLKNHTFGATTVASQQFGAASTLFDGLMGTAISTLSNQRVLTPIEALAKQGAVRAATMGYAIGRVSDGTNVGTVTFGGVNADQVANARMVEIPNVSKVGFWEAAVGNVGVNGNFLDLKGRTAILDTGTTLALIPPADAKAIHAAIPGSKAGANGLFTIPCDTTAAVAFSFGGQLFNIEPEDLLFQPVDPNNLNGQCISAIMGQAIGGNTQYLLGDSFLKGKYFATNIEQNVIGLAEQA